DDVDAADLKPKHVMGQGETYYAWNDEKRIIVVTRGDPAYPNPSDPVYAEVSEENEDELRKLLEYAESIGVIQ
ncbi:hypothetical protein GGH93_003037, partial [Coemansia aciculifera]